MGYGTGSSPVLDGDRLFIQCDNDEKSFLVALDTKTGKELWRVGRSERLWLEHAAGLEEQGADGDRLRRRAGKVRSYDPATGKQLWELGGLSGQ